MQLESAKSIVRYFPPKGTAGFECQRVRLFSRVPAPPARIRESVFFVSLKDREFLGDIFNLSVMNEVNFTRLLSVCIREFLSDVLMNVVYFPISGFSVGFALSQTQIGRLLSN